MSTNPPPTQVVQTMYAAFGRGDVPALLSHLSENVDWRINVDQTAPGAKAVPDFRPFRGRADVGEFFKIIGSDLEFHSFQPVSFLSGGNQVAVCVKMEMTVRRTKRRMKVDSMHLFTFDEAGRISHFVEYLDTLGAAGAWGVVQAKN